VPSAQASTPLCGTTAKYSLRYRGCSATGLSDGCLERDSVFCSVGLVGGIFSAGVGNSAIGIFPNGTVGLAAVVFSLLIVSFPVGGVLPAVAGVSTLPRMIGKPSLPVLHKAADFILNFLAKQHRNRH
jgi:hypothetical protein